MQISPKMGWGIVAESKRNPSRILPEAIYALSMLDSMQHEDFTQILRRFHADFTQNVLQNRSKIVTKSKPIPSGFLAESIYTLSMLD